MCLCALKTQTNKPETIVYYNESLYKVVVYKSIGRKIIRCDIIDKITHTFSYFKKNIPDKLIVGI
jgi:hypothetical protein